MAYATQSNLIERFGEQELIDILPGEGPETIDAALVTVALDDATNEINTYLAERFTLPLEETPPVLVQVTCDIARYKYYSVHATDEVKERYDARIKWLKSVVDGKAGLAFTNQPESSLTGNYAKRSSNNRLFTCDTLKGF